MKLYERMRDLRRRNGLRLKDVASAAGLSIPFLSDIERGTVNPSLETLVTLARTYNLTLQELLQGVNFVGTAQGQGIPIGLQELLADPVLGAQLTPEGSGNLTLIGCRAVTDRKPYRHRFPLSVIGYALRLYHRFPLSQRDVQELLHERGVQVSHETLRQWNIKFAPLLTEELRHREPRRGSRWHLDEVCVKVGGVKHWLWRAVDEYGDVLDILLQEHRDTQAAKSFFVRLLGEYDVPEVIHTDKLWSYGAALREIPVLHDVEHVQVVSTARCNNLVEQSHRPTRQQERGQLGFKRRKRTQEFLALHARVSNLHRHTRTTVPAILRRSHQSAALLRLREAMQQVA